MRHVYDAWLLIHVPSSSRTVDRESRMLVSRTDNHDLTAPSRQDVEFGARAFQRIMSKRRRLPRVEDVGEHYQVPHKRRRHGYQYSGDEYDNDNDDYSVKHMGDGKSMSIHHVDSKKKRRRKRRVVETRITRVFHEESEEADSGSTSTLCFLLYSLTFFIVSFLTFSSTFSNISFNIRYFGCIFTLGQIIKSLS